MRDYVQCVDCWEYTDEPWLDGYEDDGSPIYRCDECHMIWEMEHEEDQSHGEHNEL